MIPISQNEQTGQNRLVKQVRGGKRGGDRYDEKCRLRKSYKHR